MNSNDKCVKCGTTKKSGKRSCCARGGAWFKKCGYAGDTQLDHTWAEGIQACKKNEISTSVELSQLKVKLRHIAYRPDTQSRNEDQLKAGIYRSDSMSNAGATDSEDCLRLKKTTVVGICVLYIISVLQK